MLAFSNDYYGMIFRATQSVELFCAYTESVKQLRKREKKLLDIEKISYMYYNGTVTKNAHNV